jgi:uncharacterized protein (DUF1501 family)
MHAPAHDSHACTEYNALSRRRFMAVTGVSAAAAATAPSWLPRVALASSHRSGQRDVIVSIYLRGGIDGMSAVVPYQEANYYAQRATTAVPRPDSGLSNRATDLDGQFGLAPGMAALLPAYLNGNLLFVHACGSRDTTRSHFDAQRFMEVGNQVNDPTFVSGWLGRHLLTVAPKDPNALLRAVGIADGLQRALVTAPKALPIPNLDTFGLTGTSSTAAARSATLQGLYETVGDPLRAVATTTLQTIDLLNAINFAGYAPGGGAVYPTGNFGYALKTTAALIKAEVGVEAVAIDLGGWDTHNAQGTTSGTMHTLMTTLSQAIGAFYADMWSRPTPGVTLVAMSEFGRRLKENGSQGTDHGYGNVMIALGECVRGGRVLTQWPGLDPANLFQGLDLNVTIDYRDVLAEIVQSRLGNSNLAAVFPSYTPTFRGVLNC